MQQTLLQMYHCNIKLMSVNYAINKHPRKVVGQ